MVSLVELPHTSSAEQSSVAEDNRKETSRSVGQREQLKQTCLPKFDFPQNTYSFRQQIIASNPAKSIILITNSSISLMESSKTVPVEMNDSSPTDDKIFDSKLTISSITKSDSKRQNSATTHKADSARFSDSKSEFPQITRAMMGGPITEKSASFTPRLKWKTFEDSVEDPKNSNHIKCVMDSSIVRKPFRASPKNGRAKLASLMGMEVIAPKEKDENEAKIESYKKQLDGRSLSILLVLMVFSSGSFGSSCNNPHDAIEIQAYENRMRNSIIKSFKADATRVCLLLYSQTLDELVFYIPVERRYLGYRNTIQDIRVLTSEVLASRDCWVLMKAADLSLFFNNVVIMSCIHLPIIPWNEQSSHISSGVFSETPSSSGCQVFIVDANVEYVVSIWTLRMGDSEWDFRFFRIEEPITGAMGLTLHNEKLWWVNGKGRVLCLGENEIIQAFDFAPLGSLEVEKYTASLLTHNDSLFLVRTFPNPVRCFQVLQEGNSLEYDELNTLNGDCFFVLNGRSGFALHMDNVNMVNRVFIGLPENLRPCECVSYSLQNGGTRSIDVCRSRNRRCLCNGVWLPPVHPLIPPRQYPPIFTFAE